MRVFATLRTRRNAEALAAEIGELRAEVEELRETMALVVALSMETSDRVDPFEGSLRLVAS